MKFNDTFLRIIKADLATGRIIPALMGEPGIGKTSFAMSLAEKLDTKLFTIQANQLSEKADLTGVRTVPTPDGESYMQVFFPHQTIHDINEYAREHPDETPILDLEEINRTDDDVTSALLSLSTERRCGNTKLEDNIRIIVTGNTKGNVNVLDSASLSRFSIYEMEADTQVFLDVMGDNLNGYVRDVLSENPEYIFIKPNSVNDTYSAKAAQSNATDPDEDDAASFDPNMFSEEEMLQFTTPRTIHGVSNWLNVADDALLRELLTQTTSDNITMLEATLQAHTGDTEFTAALAMQIITDLNKPKSSSRGGNAAGAVAKPAKPGSYHHITTLTTRGDIENYIMSLSDEEKGELFNYTMCAPHDTLSTAIIQIVGSNLTELPTQELKLQFVRCITENLVDPTSKDEFEMSRTSLQQSLSPFLEL